MTGPVVLTEVERQAVIHSLRHDHDMPFPTVIVDRVIAAINTVKRRPRSEASPDDIDYLPPQKVQG
jgi:hypothetical protein